LRIEEGEAKVAEYRSFEEMPLWQLAHSIALDVYRITEKFPRKEDYSLTSQLRRAALSISANIAEAFGRFHYRDKLNFYYNSRGSAYETKSHLIFAHDVGYLQPSERQAVQAKIEDFLYQVNTVIASLRRDLKS
jgi:four helix bundle protein